MESWASTTRHQECTYVTVSGPRCYLKKGGFQLFKGIVEGMPLNAVLAFNRKGTGINYNDSRFFYLENEVIKISGSDSLATEMGEEVSMKTTKKI